MNVRNDLRLFFITFLEFKNYNEDNFIFENISSNFMITKMIGL